MKLIAEENILIHAYNAGTANDVWRLAWQDVRSAKVTRSNELKGDSREILHVAFGIEDPRQRFVYSRTPGINPSFAIAEVVWIIAGRSDAAFLQPWNNSLSSFTGGDSELHGAYGYRLRRHLGFDQLKHAADALRNNPMQRQIVLQVWDSRVDAPNLDGSAKNEDIPCNLFSCLKVSNGRLEWLQLMRSNDLILGLPYNIFQWTMLQEILAGWLGLELGSYNQMSDSLHIYERDLHRFSISDERSPSVNSSDLRLPEEQSEQVFRVLAAAIETIGAREDPKSVLAQLSATSLPIDYEDLLRVMVVERLRRLGSTVLACRVTGDIRSSALRTSVINWNARFKEKSS